MVRFTLKRKRDWNADMWIAVAKHWYMCFDSFSKALLEANAIGGSVVYYAASEKCWMEVTFNEQVICS